MSRWTKTLKAWFVGGRHYRFLVKDWSRLTDLDAAAQVVNTLRFTRNLQSLETQPPQDRTLLVIAPHPDDETLGPGGTLLAAAQKGCRIHVLYLTSGSNAERERRESEARAACAVLQAQATFLRWPEGAIPLDGATLAAQIGRIAPDILMLPFLLDDHDDHRRASELLLRAAPQLKARPEIWAYQVYSAVLPNAVVDITAWRERKAELARRYASQFAHRDWANFSLGLNAWNSRLLRARGAAWAEAFCVLPMDAYLELCAPYFRAGAYYSPGYAATRGPR